MNTGDQDASKNHAIFHDSRNILLLRVMMWISTIQPEIYDLYYKNETNDIIKFDTARVANLRSSKLISKLFKENDVVFVNCKFNSKFAKWEPFESSQSDNVCSKTDLL